MGCGGDPTCRAQCSTDNLVGTDPASPALDACLASKCESACGLTCGGLSSHLEPAAAAACTECGLHNLCDVMRACSTNVDCQSILECSDGRETLDVQQSCIADHDAGYVPYRKVVDDVRGSCRECGQGSQWACIGKVNWPVVKASPMTLSVRVVDILSQSAGVPGVTVKMCNRTVYAACSPADDTQTTGADGWVTITPKSSPGTYGPTGYLELSSPDGKIVPELFFWSFPLSEGQASLGQPVVTLSPSALDLLAAQAHATLAPTTHGHVALLAYDCGLSPAFGVQFAASPTDPSTQLFYVLANNTISTSVDSTDVIGVGGLVNVPAGPLTVTATPKVLGRPSSTVDVFVRPGAISLVLVPPTPTP